MFVLWEIHDGKEALVTISSSHERGNGFLGADFDVPSMVTEGTESGLDGGREFLYINVEACHEQLLSSLIRATSLIQNRIHSRISTKRAMVLLLSQIGTTMPSVG
jgi:hypothetical protein